MNLLIKRLLTLGTFIVCALIILNTLTLLFPFKAEIKYAEINNSRIVYYQRGMGEPLLLIEGFGMSMGDWDPQFLRQLAKSHTLIIYDLRGVGLSEGDTSSITIQQLADDSVKFLDHLGIKKADIFGWSMGSIVAQEIAFSNPERIDHLILASTFSADKNVIEPVRDVSDKVEENITGSWEELVPFMFTPDAKGIKEGREYILRRNEAIRKNEAPNTPPTDARTKVNIELAMGKLSNDSDRLNKLSSIKIPTLVLAGENDLLLPIDNDRLVATAIPNSKLIIFPDSGHAFLFRNSDQVVKELKRFLE